MLKKHTLTLEFEQVNSQQIKLTITDKETDQATAILSPIYENQNSKRFALKALASAFSYAIRRRLWPEDTEVYDEIKTEYGVKWANPRYPAGQ